MISYEKKISKNNKIPKHVVGKIYKDFKGNEYLFLGKCKGYSRFSFKLKSSSKYTYINIRNIKKYMPKAKSFNELLDLMVYDFIDFSTYFICLDSMKSFIEEVGSFGDLECDYCEKYQRTFNFVSKHSTPVEYSTIVNLDFSDNIRK